jgi:hypothetical protein
MSRFLKCACSHCGEHIEYPAEAAGESTICPHCGQQTELIVAVPDRDAEAPRRRWVPWVLAGFVIMGIAGASAPLLLKRALARRQIDTGQTENSQRPAGVTSSDLLLISDFAAGPILISKGTQSSIVHAVGSLSNTLGRQRYGVRVEIELADALGRPNGKATDYVAVMEPNTVWQFRAMVLSANAATGRVARIREQNVR